MNEFSTNDILQEDTLEDFVFAFSLYDSFVKSKNIKPSRSKSCHINFLQTTQGHYEMKTSTSTIYTLFRTQTYFIQSNKK